MPSILPTVERGFRAKGIFASKTSLAHAFVAVNNAGIRLDVAVLLARADHGAWHRVPVVRQKEALLKEHRHFADAA